MEDGGEVCRIFEDRRWDPQETLTEILSHQNDESLLKSTYLPVFNRIIEGQSTKKKGRLIENCLAVIGPIVLLESPLSVNSLSNLLCLSKSKIKAQLDLLRPVPDIPDEDTSPIRLFHLSLRDFLLESNSGSVERPFWVDESETHKKMTDLCLKTCESLRRNIRNLSDDVTQRVEIEDQDIIACIPSGVQYACRYWAHHLLRSNEKHTLLPKALSFLEKHFLHWVEVMSILGHVFDIIEMIHKLQMATEDDNSSTLSHFLHDANRFILKNRQIADDTPMQIYSAGILFAPQSSIIRQKFESEVPLWVLQMPRVDDRWSPELQTLEDHESIVKVIAFSPNGRLLASASWEFPVILWDPKTGAIQQRLETKCPTTSVAFSRDSRLVAAGLLDGQVRIWDIATSNMLYNLQDSKRVWSVAFSPKEQLLATGSSDHIIKLWNIEKGILRTTLTGHSKSVRSVAFSPDGMILASGSDDHTIKHWNLASDSCIGTLKTRSISAVAFSSDGQLLAWVSGDFIELWDIDRHRISQTLKCDQGEWMVPSVAFSPSNLSLALSRNNEVQIWDLKKGCLQQTLRGHSSVVSSVVFSPNGQILASGSEDPSLRLWDMMGTLKGTPEEHSSMITLLASSPDGELLASASRDKTVRICSAVTGILEHCLVGHTGGVLSVAFSPDGKLLASSSEDKTVRLWDIATGSSKKILKGHSKTVRLVVFSQDGQLLTSGSDDFTVRLWDIDTGSSRHALQCSNGIASIAVSPNGRLLAINYRLQSANLWILMTRLWEYSGHDPIFGSDFSLIAFSPDSRSMASYHRDGSLRLWDSMTGMLQDTLVKSECKATQTGSRKTLFLSNKLGSRKISVRDGKIIFRSPNESPEIWLTQDGCV
ncbi:hypothetical protein N7520_006650 [Penicillium odoratum]|uniref:uncharacterized protein n=1 Tax=Penicillium odoratum TaxID=1167516 RepID=UPI00254679BF|nr:uncharacterized protein N7520_006650 [Penicillium odoratum]KAJ5759494.1 hypothetical protein N7520_006650 [Penicillium odoratum]